ncbi:MAG: RNA-binding protein [Azospirillaceae bacterium]|nr:RNA-binding protein [Azospirillaceae bacterium]
MVPAAAMIPDTDESLLPEGEAEAVGGAKSPLRRCIASGVVGPKDGMIRFVVGPDGTVVPDVEETLPGRGLWLTADPALVEKAVAKGLFAKAARRSVRASVELRPQVMGLLRRRCLDMVGLSRRGGQAVAGFEKVAAALRARAIGTRSGIGLRLEASDGAADGRSKLDALSPGIPVVDLFDRGELGMALGRDDAVHAVVGSGPLALRLLREVDRLRALTKGAVASKPGPSAG